MIGFTHYSFLFSREDLINIYLSLEIGHNEIYALVAFNSSLTFALTKAHGIRAGLVTPES